MPPAQNGDAAALGLNQGSTWEQKAWSVGKNIAIFVGVQFAIKQFMGMSSKTATPEVVPDAAGGAVPAEGEWSPIPQGVYPLWPANTSVDVAVYVSPSIAMPPFRSMPAGTLVVDERGFLLEKGKDSREITTSISVPQTVQENGTLWAHIFVGKTGAELDPASNNYDPSKAYRVLRPLTQYLARKKTFKRRNLLSAKNETSDLEEVTPQAASIASYYHSNVTLTFIADTGNVQYTTLHPSVRQFYPLDPSGARDSTGKNGWYYPVIYWNTFWQMKKDMVELNTTIPLKTLPLNIQLSSISNWQFSLMATVDEGMKETARKAAHGEVGPTGGDGSEMEMIKQVLLDSNIYLLGTTAVVSVLHMIFELLAFKSDVGHWRKKKDNVGVSVRTILANIFMQTVILLYLLDNNENTSWMILFGQGMGVAIEAWKITKAVDVRLREPGPESRFNGILPYVVVFEDKHKLSETEEKTEEYDKIAFKYMGIVAVPLLLAYAVYSLMYDSHKSWYSFILTTLVGSVYAYGFLMMIPSLYINYRLRSVAHMPARAMMYKVLNTFIDDLFAFTIKMPILHRLATLRDDVIFFVYLYQAWAYKVDPTRINEFGQGGEDEPPKGLEGVKAGEVVAGKQPDAKAGGNAEEKAEVVSAIEGKGSARKRKGQA
ncbi:hypothetical protein LTR95_012487 [Oleoguttula sp. CCFEE 5521]